MKNPAQEKSCVGFLYGIKKVRLDHRVIRILIEFNLNEIEKQVIIY